MSKLSKILLIFSGISYLLVLIGFFLPTVWISFIFFLLHSITLLSFTFLSAKKEEQPISQVEAEDLKNQLLLSEKTQQKLTRKIR